jgi:hypothetical protein
MDTIRAKAVQQESRLLRQLAESLRRASLERFVGKRERLNGRSQNPVRTKSRKLPERCGSLAICLSDP